MSEREREIFSRHICLLKAIDRVEVQLTLETV